MGVAPLFAGISFFHRDSSYRTDCPGSNRDAAKKTFGSFTHYYWQSGSSRTLIVGNPLSDFSAFMAVKLDHSAGNLSSAKTASTGHSGTHASQSMQVSGLITNMSSSR
jgi:hypothetical protein